MYIKNLSTFLTIILIVIVLGLGISQPDESVHAQPLNPPQADLFSGIPFYFLGETAEYESFNIKVYELERTETSLSLHVSLNNPQELPVRLTETLRVYSAENQFYIPENMSADTSLDPNADGDFVLEYAIPDTVALDELRFVYMPRGYSGVVFLYYLFDRPAISGEPQEPLEEPSAYGNTGDPWKMLILIYPNTDTDYIDENGNPQHLTASMPAQDMENMKNSFLNLPHRKGVYDYSGQAAELEAHIVVVNRALNSLAPIGNGYWPSPDIVRPELNEHAPKGKYDSVIVFWQASHPVTGQSIPSIGWGLGYWPGETYANGMTYATVFNLSWAWTVNNQSCRGEVFLHEWLHGVTGFYMSKGVPFNYEDLHGAEEATAKDYVTPFQQTGCWEVWLRDYMRGLVYENGVRKALVPEISWHKGAVTTYVISGWRGEYFNNQTLAGIPVMVRNDADINFEWELAAPHPLVYADGFSTRWTRQIYFEDGIYKFELFRDDGIRLKIDGVTVLENWAWGREWISVDRTMTAGYHTIQVEAYEIDGYASAILTYTKLLPGNFTKISPAASAAVQTYRPLLTWAASSGASSYEVCIEAGISDNVCNGQWVSTGGSTSYQIASDLIDGAKYHWQVRALNQNGNTPAQDGWREFTVSIPIPSMPPNLRLISTTSNSVTVGWNDVEFETGYKIYKWGVSQGIWGFYYLATLGANSTIFTESNLDCNASYWYEVSAFNSHGESAHAGWVIGNTTACPSSVTISGASGTGGVTLTYQDGGTKSVTADSSGNYTITVPAGWSGTVTPAKTGYTFSPVSRTYGNLTSNLAGQNYTAVATAPAAFNKISPANNATNQDTSLTLSWQGSVGANSYEYCYDTTNDNLCTGWASTGAATSTNLSGLVADTTYYWHVRAVNPGGATYANGSIESAWSFTTSPAITTATFADVPVTYWAWSFVERLYNAGITGGCATSPTLAYCPDATVTRAQMAVFLLKSMHGAGFNPPLVGDSTGFGDVATSHWAAPWIKQLALEGITGGCGNGNYCPEAPVTRAQMAVFLLKAKNGSGYTPPLIGDGSGFTDVPDNYWAAVWIKQLAADGITGGCGAGIYCPESPVTRAQMAVFIVKTFILP